MSDYDIVEFILWMSMLDDIRGVLPWAESGTIALALQHILDGRNLKETNQTIIKKRAIIWLENHEMEKIL